MSDYEMKQLRSAAKVQKTIRFSIIVFIVSCMAMMGGCPIYNVWNQGLAGEAELARAEQNRQIAINEAKAKKESAVFLADSEIERARGVAEANRIIADGLGGPEGYLRYLYIEGLKEAEANGDKVIYIPTEAGLPILEANRLR